MLTIGNVLLAIVAIAFVIWLYPKIKEGTNQVASIFAMCDAGEAFWDWRYRNPGVYIGLSPEGQKLLLRYIRAYEEWLIYRKKTDRSHYDFLISLLNDFPPNEPNDMPPSIAKKPPDAIKGLLSLFPMIFPIVMSHNT